MTKKNEKKPEKIDIADFLGPSAPGATDSGEIELLDPGTGAPMRHQTTRTAETASDPGLSGEQVAAALAEKDKYHDLWIRGRADFENFRKRIEREREEERAQAGASLVREILPVLDNLERALNGAPEGEPFRDGVALIWRQLKDCLTRAGLEPIEALGATFNPVYHEAVVTERTNRFEPNMILDEIQKGYMFRGRVLRPSLVKVAVKPEETAGNEGAVGE
jgi:molecular chaperone GrpE